MDTSVQKCAGGQHHGARQEFDADLGHGADHTVAFDHQVIDSLLEQPQVRLIFQARADRLLVQNAVGLGPRRAHGRPLRRIQYPELDAGFIGRDTHRAAHRIDFADQVALADAADRWITGHLSQRFDIMG